MAMKKFFMVMIIFQYFFSFSAFAHRLPPLITMPRENSALYCNSWRNAVETNAAVNWTVPDACIDYADAYMNSEQYRLDSVVIAENALTFAKTVNVTERDVWIFDVDDTLLSTVPYNSPSKYGLRKFHKSGAFKETEFPADLPALPASLALYKKLQQQGFKIILLTGRPNNARDVTEKNLEAVGYSNWERLIMRYRLLKYAWK